MTVRVTINRVCDRCQKPFEGGQFEYGDELPEYDRSKLTLTRETISGKTGEVVEKVLLALSDLCESCDGVVEKAVHKLRMDPAPKKEPEPDHVVPESPKPTGGNGRRAKAASTAKLAAEAAKKAKTATQPEPEPTPPAPEPEKETSEEEDPPF